MKCELCKINEADKTGSHFLTFAIIKSAINDAGRVERDKEVVFTLTAGRNFEIEPYFGRTVLPESIEEVLNREVKPDDFIENHNPFTEDYLFCTSCENRFGIIETYFTGGLYKNLKNNQVKTQNDSKGNKIFKIKDQIGLLIRLFFYVQLWRTSVSNDSFKLSKKIEESLRRIIDSCLENNVNKTLENCKVINSKIKNLPMTVTYWETEINTENKFEYTTNLIYFHDKSDMPYFTIINDFVIRFYQKESHLRSTLKHFFGFSDIFNLNEHINFNEKEFVIGILEDTQRKGILEGIIHQPVEMFYKNWTKHIIYFHKIIFGFTPSEYVLKGTLSEIIYSNEVIAEKYNHQKVIEIISKVFYELYHTRRFDFKYLKNNV